MRTLLHLAFLFAALGGWVSTAAAAAPFASVSYAIQAGSTATGNLGNTVVITPGGTLTFTPPGGGLSIGLPCVGACGSIVVPTFAFTKNLTAFTGAFSIAAAVGFTLNVTKASLATALAPIGVTWPTQIPLLPPVLVPAGLAVLKNGSTFTATFSNSGLSPTTPIRTFGLALGNEVRVFVPEPSSGLLLGAGLGLLGLAGGGGRIAARRRSRQR
jgi:hypothetical protein